jgi:riboflavin biosynthesis pyrimidine reductase
VADGVRALKDDHGLQVHGSANLIQTLLDHGLVDEFRLKIFPVVLGEGKHSSSSSVVEATCLVAVLSSSAPGTSACGQHGAKTS